MKYFKTNSWGNSIEEVEVLRVTNSFVVVMWNGKERRESINNYFPSLDAAKDAIINRELSNVNDLKKRLEYAEASLNEARKKLNR